MKTRNVAILIAVLVILAGGLYLASKDSSTPSSKAGTAEDKMMEADPLEGDSMMQQDLMEAPEGAYVYNIESGNVSYFAHKMFFEKADIDVEGVTPDVTGEGWYDVDAQQMYLAAKINLLNIETDTLQRDEDVQNMLTVKDAYVESGLIDASDVVLGEEFTLVVPAKLTIMNVTRDVEFTITGTVTENDFAANGSTTVLMSSFSINPPSFEGVFEVVDEIELRFDIVGTRVTE